MKTAIIIPARLESTRLPRKLLLSDSGRSIIEQTYTAARQSRLADAVLIATDSDEIAAEVERFGGRFVMTRSDHVCGTDRVAEAVERLAADPTFDVDLVVNLQGDEPEIEPAAIDLAIDLLRKNPSVPVSSLATPIRSRAQLEDPSCVKVVLDGSGKALYFSRSPIPHPRNWHDEWFNDVRDGSDNSRSNKHPVFLQHIGLYAYRQEFLSKVSVMPAAEIETIESLEQLRILHAGHSIAIGIVEHAAAGIDTAEDYAAFVNRQKNC